MNKKTKLQFLSFACCSDEQGLFVKAVQEMLLSFSLHYSLKEFRYSFSPRAGGSSHFSSNLSLSSTIKQPRDDNNNSHRGEDRGEDEFQLNYSEESQDGFSLKMKKIIRLC